MATIEERAKAIAEEWKKDIIRGCEDLSFTHLELVAKQAATEQDRIARQEERERCIDCMRVFRNTHNMSRYYIRPKNGLTVFDVDLFIEDIRKAMEGGVV